MELVAKAENYDRLLSKGISVENTIIHIKRIIEEKSYQVKNLAEYLKRETDEQTAIAIWQYIRSNYKYQEEKGEVLRTPARLHQDKIGDCDCFTIFICSILKEQGKDFKMRVTKYEEGEWQHIYPILISNNKEYVIDCVPEIKKPLEEEKYLQKKDYIFMTKELGNIMVKTEEMSKSEFLERVKQALQEYKALSETEQEKEDLQHEIELVETIIFIEKNDSAQLAKALQIAQQETKILKDFYSMLTELQTAEEKGEDLQGLGWVATAATLVSTGLQLYQQSQGGGEQIPPQPADFDSALYHQQNRDVTPQSFPEGAWVHYFRHGQKEGRTYPRATTSQAIQKTDGTAVTQTGTQTTNVTEPPAEEKSWFSKNWAWVAGAGAVLVIVAIVLFSFVFKKKKDLKGIRRKRRTIRVRKASTARTAKPRITRPKKTTLKGKAKRTKTIRKKRTTRKK